MNNNQPATVSASAPITAIVEAVSGAPVTANTNLITAIAAGLLEERQAAGTAISTAAILQANRDVAQAVLGQPVDNLGAIDLMQANADTNAAQLLAFQLSVAAANTSTPNAAAKQLAKNLQNNRPFGASEDGTAINRAALLARTAEVSAGGLVNIGSGSVPLETILTNLPGSPTTTNVRTGAGAIETVILGASKEEFLKHLLLPNGRGVVTQTWGQPGAVNLKFCTNDDRHTGVDFANNDGDQVVSATSGKVIDVDKETMGRVAVWHQQSSTTFYYLHMKEIEVTLGQEVVTKMPLGKVDSLGNTTGPHLHFEARSDQAGNRTHSAECFTSTINPYVAVIAARASNVQPVLPPSPTPPPTSPPPPSPPGSNVGTLILTGAPASTGGTFAPDNTRTSASPGAIMWLEAPTIGTVIHGESVLVNFNPQTGQVIQLLFSSVDSPLSTGWNCSAFSATPCSGVTVDRTAGTLTVVNQVLKDSVSSSQITVNGTLTFPPLAAPAPTTPSPSPPSPPSLTVGPASLNFGDVQVGTCSTAALAIQHVLGTGPATGTVSVSPISPFSLVSGGSFSVSNGLAADVSVGFCPTSAGAASGTVTVSTSATVTGASTVTLSGTGTAIGGGGVSPAPPSPSPPPGGGGGGGGSTTAGTWTATGNLISARSLHTATLLPNGKVLAVGGGASASGNANVSLASAELYDPVPGTWTTTGNLATARGGHTATVLSNGKVLVASGLVLVSVGGGGVAHMGELPSAELYDPATGTWTPTGNLLVSRSFHTTTLLPNGKVLAAGGIFSSPGGPSSAELYDPATGTWASTGNLNADRSFHTATLLPNGKVLVVGGSVGDTTLASAELYDPVSGAWTVTGSLVNARSQHTATLLPSGKVLVAGGAVVGSTGGTLPSAELYDPATGSWTPTGNLNAARSFHTATLLPNGKVLVASGLGSTFSTLASAELYDPTTETWTPTRNLSAGRDFHTATLLPNGKVLVAGGSFGNVSLGSAELYDPSTGSLSP